MSINRDLRYAMGTQFPVFLFGLVAAVFLARLLGPEGRGALALFQADVQLLIFMVGLSIPQGLVYFLSSQKLGTGELVGIALILTAVGFSLCCVLLLVSWVGAMGTFFLPPGYAHPMSYLYLAGAFASTQLGTVADGLIQGSKGFRSSSLASLSNSVANAVAFGGALFLQHRHGWKVGVPDVLVLTLLLMLVNTTTMWLLCARRLRVVPNLRVSLQQHVRPFLAYVRLVHLAVFVNFLNYRLDVWIVGRYSGTEELGFYVLAVNAAQLLWLVSNPLCAVLLPYLASGSMDQRLRRLRSYARLNTSLLVLLGTALYAGADPLIQMLYGHRFADSVEPLRILLPGVFLLGLTKVYGTFFAATDRFRLNMWSNVIGLISTVVLCLMLIPRFGIIGACVATNASYASMFVFTFLAFSRTTNGGGAGYFLLQEEDVRTWVGREPESTPTSLAGGGEGR